MSFTQRRFGAENGSPPSINLIYESISDMGGIFAAFYESQGDYLKFPSRSPHFLMKLAIKVDVSYTCNYSLIDSSAS